MLGSLGTIASILAGFVLAGLVSMAAEGPERFDNPFLQAALFCWIGSGLLILLVLVMAEFLRSREQSERVINATADETEQLERSCEKLLNVFAFALLATAGGIVILGFYFSWIHGLVGVVVALVGVGLALKYIP